MDLRVRFFIVICRSLSPISLSLSSSTISIAQGWIMLCKCAFAFGKFSYHARNTIPGGNSISCEVAVGVWPRNLAALARTSLISDVKINFRSCVTLICRNMTSEKTRWSFFSSETLRISFSRISLQQLSSYISSVDMMNATTLKCLGFSKHFNMRVTV